MRRRQQRQRVLTRPNQLRQITPNQLRQISQPRDANAAESEAACLGRFSANSFDVHVLAVLLTVLRLLRC